MLPSRAACWLQRAAVQVCACQAGVYCWKACATGLVSCFHRHCLQDTTNSIWAFARLFHYPCNDLLRLAATYCLRHWHRWAALQGRQLPLLVCSPC